MISHTARKWMAAIYLLVIPSVDPQMAMYPVFPPPVQVAVPMPMPVPVPIMIRDEYETTRTTTTTTTTERSRMGIPFPLPMPMPMPMAVPFAFPAFPALSCKEKDRPKGCPPCPPCLCFPSCTPTFFSYCSPCHQKCRCNSKKDTPKPVPPSGPPPIQNMGPAFGVAVPVPPMFAPPPVVVMPFPPFRPPRRPPSSSSSYSSDCTDTDSDDSYSYSYEDRRKRKKKIGHAKRRPIYRRQFDSLEVSDNELVKPVLTYVSKNGDVKLKKQLSNDEAAELINDKPYQRVRVTADEDGENMPRVLITSKNERNSGRKTKEHRRRQVILSRGQAQHMLGEGKKELVFRPPSGKKISNLSVSFQISE